MTEASVHRIEIARRVAEAFSQVPGYAASFVTGSSAEGIADDASDIDMSLFFHSFPGEEALDGARLTLDPNAPKWVLGSYADEEVCVSIQIDDIEVQYGVGTVAQMDAYCDKICAGEMGTSPEIKIAIGTLFAIPFHGADLIDGWKHRFRVYPEGYRTATLEAYVAQRNLLELYGKIERRNAEIWTRRELIDRVYATFAALGALNRVWFSQFQLKRSDAWCAKLTVAPPDLASRASAVAELPLLEAIPICAALVDDARELVRRNLDG